MLARVKMDFILKCDPTMIKELFIAMTPAVIWPARHHDGHESFVAVHVSPGATLVLPHVIDRPMPDPLAFGLGTADYPAHS